MSEKYTGNELVAIKKFYDLHGIDTGHLSNIHFKKSTDPTTNKGWVVLELVDCPNTRIEFSMCKYTKSIYIKKSELETDQLEIWPLLEILMPENCRQFIWLPLNKKRQLWVAYSAINALTGIADILGTDRTLEIYHIGSVFTVLDSKNGKIVMEIHQDPQRKLCIYVCKNAPLHEVSSKNLLLKVYIDIFKGTLGSPEEAEIEYMASATAESDSYSW